jgi:enoyl-CoA hydratase
MEDTGLRVERVGPVGWLLFDRPRVGNAMNGAMMSALPAVWAELDADPEVRCIVVTGKGKAFQTGLDMAALAKDPASMREQSRQTKAAALRLTNVHNGIETPVICAVNGVCAGGGLHFVVDADLVIASDRASFLDPHVSVGQGSAWEAVGLAARGAFGTAARIVLLAAHERLGAEDARRLGLLGEVVPAEQLRDRAQQLAEAVADADPAVARARRRALWTALELGRVEALHTTIAALLGGDHPADRSVTPTSVAP